MKSIPSDLDALLAMAPAVPIERYVDQLAAVSAGTAGLTELLAAMTRQVDRLESLTPPNSRALALDLAALQRVASKRRNHDLSDGSAGCGKIDEFGMTMRIVSDEWAAVWDQGYQLMWTVNPFLAGDWPHRASRYRWAAVQEALAALNIQGWCGHRDWRMPTIDELRTLSYTKRAGGKFVISPDLFPDVQGDGMFWSSSRDTEDPQAAQAWDFVENGAVSRPLSAFAHVRFVRSTGTDV